MKTTGREYAIALFETAYESGNIDGIRNDIRAIKRLLKDMPVYIEFLSNPGIPKKERMEALRTAFEGKVDDVVYSFLAVMTEGADMGSFFDAYKEFEHMYEDYKRFTYAEITSAVELTEEEKAKLVAKLESVTGKTVRPKYKINPALMGGITVTADGMFFDGSVRKNLKNLEKEIS
jgi:F-type H+-transporting ATPase subunit delta